MVLSGRLKAIADAVPRSPKAADIGTDHGYVPLSLLQDRRIDYAIAADISPGSLAKAEILMRQHHMEHCMETRLGSGLSVLSPGEANTVILAGMGGLLIRDILEEGEAVARSASTLVLQPMTAQEELRRWLVSHGYGITGEDLVREERRIYEILIAVPDREAPEPDREIYYDIGWKLVESGHPLLEEFIGNKIRNLEEIIAKLEAADTAAAKERQAELEERLRQVKEVFRCHIR